MSSQHDTIRLREELSQTIASHIVDGGLDWAAARARALEDFSKRTRLPANALPTSEQIETAVRAHFALFDAQGHARVLLAKRRLAVRVLGILGEFDAYLTGAVLNGAATRDSPVCIEVFTDDIKAVLAALMDAGLDIEALDPRTSAFGRAIESVGFIMPWDGGFEAVRIDVLEPQQRFANPARRRCDAYQSEWEALGRISAENLQKIIEHSLSS